MARAGEPHVTKHWSQDWTFQAPSKRVYSGHNTWTRVPIEDGQGQGTWLQSVYQVDDSPRYASSGRWQHAPGYSSWLGNDTWRPLPRREFSVRDDYQVLIGSNRHTISPAGWVHEQINLKSVIDDQARLDPVQAHVAREISVNRYERIAGFDFSAGYDYWHDTVPAWAEIRAGWARLFDDHARLSLRSQVDDQRLVTRLFELAARENADMGELQAQVRHVLAAHSDLPSK